MTFNDCSIPVSQIITIDKRPLDEGALNEGLFDEGLLDRDDLEIAIRTMVNELSCPICLQPMQQPMTLTTCAHTFCSDCLHASQKRKQACPLCNAKVTKRTVMEDAFFTELMQKLNDLLDCYALVYGMPWSADYKTRAEKAKYSLGAVDGNDRISRLEGMTRGLRAQPVMNLTQMFPDVQKVVDEGKTVDEVLSSDDEGEAIMGGRECRSEQWKVDNYFGLCRMYRRMKYGYLPDSSA